MVELLNVLLSGAPTVTVTASLVSAVRSVDGPAVDSAHSSGVIGRSPLVVPFKSKPNLYNVFH